MSNIVKNAAILTAITLIAGIALGGVHAITAEPIVQAQAAAKEAACKKILPEAEGFEQMDLNADAAERAIKDSKANAQIDEVFGATKGNELVGYVISTTDKDGYGGNIKVSVGLLPDGTVNGISLLELNETAGLGMKAAEPAFYEQYAGVKTDRFHVDKDGGDGAVIDSISGATITSRAVTGAVNAALAYYNAELGGGK